MSIDAYNIQIVMILAVGLALATILGYISQRVKLSPILGYLIAGYLIGPYSPGFVADVHVAEQLAEIGVILMMFGVGLHLKWQELINVKNIAIPGAIIQTACATIAGTWITHYYGWSLESGVVIGLAIGVASTVVMIRILSDHHLVLTTSGHISIGWLIVEDILTVIALLLLPSLAASFHGDAISIYHVAEAIGIAILKCCLLVLIMIYMGFKVVSYIFVQVARTKSQELFTLTVLSVIFVVATGSALIFGTSIALGAFIAGLVIGQTDVRHQASANALPLKDMFAVIFFLSVGMLFSPSAIIDNFSLFIGVMAVILLIKPLVAFLIVVLLKYPAQTALVVAIALAQIGEFSFILVEEALKLNIIPDEAFDIIVACALISIGLNPVLFSVFLPLGKWYKKQEHAKATAMNHSASSAQRAIIVGFGPIGNNVAKILEQIGITPVIVDTNVDTITLQKDRQREAIFGDATIQHILEAAHIETASILIITTPDIATTLKIVDAARKLKSDIKILARSLYANDQKKLRSLNVSVICDEEESKQAFIRSLANLERNMKSRHLQ